MVEVVFQTVSVFKQNKRDVSIKVKSREMLFVSTENKNRVDDTILEEREEAPGTSVEGRRGKEDSEKQTYRALYVNDHVFSTAVLLVLAVSSRIIGV